MRGWLGEFKTVLAKKVFLRSRDYVDINDVTIETNRGTTQIDHVIVSRYGLFVVESKNMTGWIFGNENDPYWTKTNWGKKYKFPNPLNQNKSHIRALSRLAKVPTEKMHSVVVFWGNCNLRTAMPSNRFKRRLCWLHKEQATSFLHRRRGEGDSDDYQSKHVAKNPGDAAAACTSIATTLREHHNLRGVRQSARSKDGQIR